MNTDTNQPFNKTEEHVQVLSRTFTCTCKHLVLYIHLLEYVIFQVGFDFFNFCTEPGDWVYVPCMGSGAEVEAALLCGLNVVCCDILEVMFHAVKQRMDILQRQLDAPDFNLATHLGMVDPEAQAEEPVPMEDVDPNAQ